MTFESKSWVYYNSVNFVINSNVRNQETSKGLRNHKRTSKKKVRGSGEFSQLSVASDKSRGTGIKI